MSQTIDDRVVQLEFENQGFESGVKESLSTLQKLKNSLNFTDASRNLTALSNAASKFNLSGITDAVEIVGEKFSYMKYAGLVALSNIVTGAMQAGHRIANALIGPITSGGWNRAMNLEQANFMLDGVLKDADKVDEVMKAVNQSVDGTAYSLDAAAKVASQFAATGIHSYEDMLKPLEAIAGVAGMTNASFEEIGDIFTTVKSRGKMTREEINRLAVRGLAALPALATEMGKTEDEVSTMISKGLVDFDTFTNAMHNAFSEQAKKANDTFTGAMSNVRSALGRIGAEFATPFIRNMIPVLNDFRLAINATKNTLTPFFTTSASVMEALSKKVSAALQKYTSFVNKHSNAIKGIFQDLINSAKNVIGFASQISSVIREAFDSTFEGKTLAYFKKISVAIFNLTSKLKLTSFQAGILKFDFVALFSIFDTLGYIIRRVAHSFNIFIPYIQRGAEVLSYRINILAGHLYRFNESVKSSEFLKGNVFENAVKKISSLFDKISNKGFDIKEVFGTVKDSIYEAFKGNLKDVVKFEENIQAIKDFFTKLFNKIKEIFAGIGKTVGTLFTNIPGLFGNLVQLIEQILSAVVRALQGFLNSQTVKTIGELAQSGLFIALVSNLVRATKDLKIDNFKGFFSFFENFGKVNLSLIDLSPIKQLTGTIKSLAKESAQIQTIKAIGPTLLELAAALFIISSLDTDRLVIALGAVTALIAEFVGSAYLVTKQADGIDLKVFGDLNTMYLKMATTILILSGALALLSTIDPKQMAVAVAGITAIFALLTKATSSLLSMNKDLMRIAYSFGKLSKQAANPIKDMAKLLMKYAMSIAILALALKLLSTIPLTHLIDGLIAFSVVVLETTLAMKAISKLDAKDDVGKAIRKLASGLLVLALALKLLSTIDIRQMGVALLGLTVGLMTMVVALGILAALSANSGSLFISVDWGYLAKSLLIASIGLVALAGALKIISTIDTNKMLGTLVLMVGTMTTLVMALTALSIIANELEDVELMKIAGTLLITSAAMLVLSTALAIIGSISNVAGTIIIFSTAMLTLCVAIAALSEIDTKKLFAVSAALVILSAGLLVISVALATIGAIGDVFGTVLGLAVALFAINEIFYSLARIKIKNLIAVSSAMVIMSGALLVLSVALAVIGGISNSISVLEALIPALIGIAVVFGSLARIKPKALFSVAGAMVVMSGALLVLSVALAVIGGMQNAMNVLIALGPALLGITVVFAALAMIKLDRLMGAASAMVIMSGALLILSVAFSVMGKIGNAVNVVMALGPALVALSLALALLSKVDSVSLIAAAGAMIILSGSLWVIAQAINVLKDIPAKTLAVSVGALALALVGLGAALAIISKAWLPILIGAGVIAGVVALFALGVAALGAALIVVGKGIEVIGVGLVKFTAGITAASEVLPKVAESLVLTAKTLLVLVKFAPALLIVSATLAAIGIGLLVFGAGANIVGAGLILMGKGLALVSMTIVSFAKALKEAGIILNGSKDAVNAFVITMLKLSALAILSPLILLLGVAFMSLGAGLTLVGTGLTLTAVGINLMLYALQNLAMVIQQIGPIIVEILLGAIISIKDTILNIINFIKNIDWEAVLAVLKKVGNWIKEKAKAVWEWFKANLPIWIDALKEKLKEMWENLKIKVSEKWEEIKDIFKQKWEEFKTEIGRWKDELIEKGKFIIQGLINGIEEGLKNLGEIPGRIREKIIGGIESKFRIASPSKDMYWEGLMMMAGLNDGVEEGMDETGNLVDDLENLVEGGIGGVVDSVKDKVSSFFSLDITKANKEIEGSISDVTTKLANGNITMSEWADTAGKSWQRVKDLTNELNRLKGEYDAGRMSEEEYKAATYNLEQELYNLIGSFEDLQEALSKVDDEIRLEESNQRKYEAALRSGTASAQYLNKELEKSRKNVHDLKEVKYNLTKQTEKNTEATKDETDAIDGLNKSLDSTTTSSKSAASAQKEFGDSLKLTLEGQLDIFKKFEAKNPMNKTELLENMKSQIKGMTDWAGQMAKLATMGIDKGLYQKLAKMGPQGAEYVGAFASMTAEELAQANELWAQSLVLPGNVAKGIEAEWGQLGEWIPKGWANGIAGNKDEAVQAVEEMDKATYDAAHDGAWDFGSPSETAWKLGFWIDLGLGQGVLENMHFAIKAIETMCNLMVEKARQLLDPENFKPIGAGVVEGVQQGIEENMSILETAMTKLASMVEQAARSKEGFDVNSPSKRMIPIGEGIGEGLALGIDRSGSVVSSSITDMSDNAIAAMKYTVANIAAMINDEMEDPVIRPVLDLSNVQAGVRTLNSVFSTNQALKAGSALSTLQNGQSIGTNGVQFIQNNYSPKALSRVEIYRQTRNLVSRYNQA